MSRELDEVDEEPISEEEIAYAKAYWVMLSQGEPEPDRAGFDPERLARIRAELERRWWEKVRRITRRGRT